VCLIYDSNDDWSGAPTTNIGQWTEVAEDWELVVKDCDEDNDLDVLEAPNVEDALAVTTETALSYMQWVRIRTCQATLTTGTKIRIIINYKDTNNYFYAEIEENDAALFSADGTELARASDSPEAAFPLTLGWGDNDGREWALCLNEDGVLTLETDPVGEDQTALHACVSPISGGLKAGIGNGADITFHIENFRFENHFDRLPWLAGYEICPQCCCRQCDEKCMPETLNVHISDGGGCGTYPGSAGDDFTIYLNRTDSSCNEYNPWDSVASKACWESFHFFMELLCESPWVKLYVDPDGTCDTEPAWHDVQNDRDPVEIICDPFYAKFEVEDWANGDTGYCDPGRPGEPGYGTLIVEIT
jgi:hypothetical protein